jgi:hypothetical protein
VFERDISVRLWETKKYVEVMHRHLSFLCRKAALIVVGPKWKLGDGPNAVPHRTFTVNRNTKRIESDLFYKN